MCYDIGLKEHIGSCCREFRVHHLGMTQGDVSKECGYSRENISRFEHGKNDNHIIFLWYVKHGLLNVYSIDELVGW